MYYVCLYESFCLRVPKQFLSDLRLRTSGRDHGTPHRDSTQIDDVNTYQVAYFFLTIRRINMNSNK